MAASNLALFGTLFFWWMPTHTSLPEYYALQYYSNPDVNIDNKAGLIVAMLYNAVSLTSLKTIFLWMLLPLLCIPCLGFSYATLGALPGIIFIICSSNPQVHHPGNHYLLLVLPFLWIGCMDVLSRKDFKTPHALAAGIAIVGLSFWNTFLQDYGAIFQGLLASTNWRSSYAEDIRRLKSKVQPEAYILIDANFQPSFAEYQNVRTILGFYANPAPLNDRDFSEATDVITVTNLKDINSCADLKPSEDDPLRYDYQTFYKYCDWLRRIQQVETAYPDSNLLHIRIQQPNRPETMH